MKTLYLTLILLAITITSLAQGIAVQGIARDNANGAIVNQSLNFSFEIVNADDMVKYTESENIRTDRFGVFSHILGAGNRLQNVDFSEDNLKIKVSVTYNGNIIIVYNETFNYAPYAHYAKNGVPTGSIMPFMGTEAPQGWLLCDGREIPSQYTKLRAMFSNNRTPNLKGRFLKGAGFGGGHNAIPTTEFDQTTLGQYQTQALQNHRHDSGGLVTSDAGAHSHRIYRKGRRGGNGTSPLNVTVSKNTHDNLLGESNDFDGEIFRTSSDGNHNHTITGDTGNAKQASGTASTQPLRLSSEETRPHNFSVNYIIKL